MLADFFSRQNWPIMSIVCHALKTKMKAEAGLRLVVRPRSQTPRRFQVGMSLLKDVVSVPVYS